MKILIAGDFCPKDRVAKAIESQSWDRILAPIENYTAKVDYSILNFECPIFANGANPISKKGPNLSCSSNAIEVIKNAGFDCVTLANNHFRDFGDISCIETTRLLYENGIDYLGGGKNIKEAQKVLCKTIDNKTVAFVNFCENEFSIAAEEHAGSAPLNLVDNYYQIQEARQKADYVIVIVHGGHEYFQFPSPRMKKTYHWFVDLGADAVINHHQHCYSGYEQYKGRPIFYGLGNFCFDWNGRRNSPWNEGYFVVLNIEKAIFFEVVPYTQCNESATVDIMSKEQKTNFIKTINEINAIIADDESLSGVVANYYNECVHDCEIAMGNFSENKYIRGLKRKHIISSQVSINKRNILSDFIFCESHRDKVEHWLNKK